MDSKTSDQPPTRLNIPLDIYDEIRGDLPQKLAEYQRWTISRLLDRLAGEAR